MNKCTGAVVNWLIRHSAITEEEEELYKYALHSAVLLVLPILLAGGIGICFGNITSGIMLVLPVMVLRKFSGGYHTKNLRTCILGSGLLLVLCISLSMHMKCDWKLATATVIASVSLIVFSPIDSVNRELDSDEKRTYKLITIFCVLFFGLLNITLYLLGKYIYTICSSVGILLTAGLQVPCVIIKIINQPKSD